MNDLPDALTILQQQIDFLNGQLANEHAKNIKLADELGMLKWEQLAEANNPETPDTEAEPAEDEDRESFVDAICSLAAAVDGKAEELPPLSEWMKTVIDKVRHSNGVVTVDVRDLVKAIRELEANQRPEPVDLGTSIQTAIAALPVTFRADATELAEVATAAGEPVLGLRLLVSMRDELIDREATCGKCKRYKPEVVPHASWCQQKKTRVYANTTACAKIQRKPPESSEETGSLAEEIRLTGLAIKRTAAKKKAESESEPVGKARFFRDTLGQNVKHDPVWCMLSEEEGMYFNGRCSTERSNFTVNELTDRNDVKQITEAQAFAELADWPEGEAKLRELIGGNDE